MTPLLRGGSLVTGPLNVAGTGRGSRRGARAPSSSGGPMRLAPEPVDPPAMLPSTADGSAELMPFG
eukprot:CAMPEP_0204176752 /NCGR_PEP_ID=MMETSP0361-20130328/47887_1 /ASSEMBLY_ACC=CAM_ASM_000343 /TAXON_ID=268821 /ORGANISM="Scrippsiella Hangoei, Strain SHTV-5" /LENGTH=65 /DNA_ID=CAMNT_0051135609 /DNA_START=105 /DNA_END=300 /DNA_ORIENTATION=+